MSFPYIIQGSNITVVIGSKSHTVTSSHIMFNQLREAIRVADWDRVKDIIEPKMAVLNYGAGNVSIQGQKLFWKGAEMHNAIATKMVDMLKEGFNIEPLVLFMENLMQNPSKRAVDEFYKFAERGQLPITPDGCVLAFKKVRTDWRDVHSGTVLNKPAELMTPADFEYISSPLGVNKDVTVTIENGVTVVTMPRNGVDDNRDNTCSDGLHFCSQGYLGSFGGSRVLIVKVNPRDVVSVPSDYQDTKARCCRYEVVSEMGAEERPEEVLSKPVQDFKPEQDVKPEAKAAPTEPHKVKVGSGTFYRGYQAGYIARSGGKQYDNFDWKGRPGAKGYSEGYAEGWDDAVVQSPMRYVYVPA